MKKTQDTNVCGIIGVSTGWLIPIAGITLGIIALARKEKSKSLGIISIIMGTLAWALWTTLLL